ELHLLRGQVAEGPLDRLLRRSRHAASRLQLAVADRNADLDAVQTHRSVAADRACVNRTWRERIRREQIATALLRHADEMFLAGLLVLVTERSLIVLERAHLLELLLDPAPPFQGQLQDFAQLGRRWLPVRIQDLHKARDRPAHCLAVTS